MLLSFKSSSRSTQTSGQIVEGNLLELLKTHRLFLFRDAHLHKLGTKSTEIIQTGLYRNLTQPNSDLSALDTEKLVSKQIQKVKYLMREESTSFEQLPSSKTLQVKNKSLTPNPGAFDLLHGKFI